MLLSSYLTVKSGRILSDISPDSYCTFFFVQTRQDSPRASARSAANRIRHIGSAYASPPRPVRTTDDANAPRHAASRVKRQDALELLFFSDGVGTSAPTCV